MNKRNLQLSLGRTLLTVSALALLAALVGVPVYLGLWQLAVYPAVIGGLILFWVFLEHKAKTDPNDALGFLDHGHAMRFVLLFGMPSMLFLAGWTIYLALGRDPILSKSALVIAGLVLSLLILSGPLSEFFAGLFAEQRAGKRRGRKPRKGAKAARKSWLHWIAPVFSPYLKLEAKLTTGIAKGGESAGQKTQFSQTVFHFRSIALNVIVLVIRAWWGEPALWATYLQMGWIIMACVGWGIYLKKSASGVPIVEPGDVLGVVVFGFCGGYLLGIFPAYLVHFLMTSEWDTTLVKALLTGTLAFGALLPSWLITGWLHKRFEWKDQSFLSLVLAIWLVIAGVVYVAIPPLLYLF
ncbi:hypothetical protein OAH95_00490 [Burkholderiaceae bacterium]|nr:hypothetical protein [Burkholderiaceae bacterium]